MAATQEQMDAVYNNSLKFDMTDEELENISDVELMSRLIGRRINPRFATVVQIGYAFFDNIYIDGFRLTDMLGNEDNKDLSKYADAVRDALRSGSNSVITLKKGSFLSGEVQAVMRENTNGTTEEKERIAEKKNAALEFTVNYSSGMREDFLNRRREGIVNNAIKIDISNNIARMSDADLIKAVTGAEEMNAANRRSVLDSIYINGKNLTDILGEDKENNINEYANAIRNALDTSNDSFITIMKKNSVFAKPRAVILEHSGSSDEAGEQADQKSEASVHYATVFREMANKKVTEAVKRRDDRTLEDEKLFFSSLFDKNDDLSYPDFARQVQNKFDNLIPDYVHDRKPEDVVYAYMLTLDDPQNPGKKLTLDRILSDDSQQMKELKKNAGAEFCNLFQKKPGIDNTEYYNTTIHPLLIKISNAALQQKSNYYDLNDIDNLENAERESLKTTILHDLAQQMEKANVALTSANNGLYALSSHYYRERLEYLSTSIYADDTIYYERNSVDRTVCTAADFESMFDSISEHDIKTVLNTEVGRIEPAQDQRLRYIQNVDPGKKPSDNDIINYVEGKDNNLAKKYINVGNVFKEAALQLERDKDIEIDDYVLRDISMCAPENFRLTPNMLRDIYNNNGSNMRVHNSDSDIGGYYGFKNSIIAELTGCHIPLGDNAAMPKEYLMAALNAIYINDQPATERFRLSENNIMEKYRDVEKEIAGILLDSMVGKGNDHIILKRGRDSFFPVDIDIGSVPMEEFEAGIYDREKYSTLRAYMDARQEELNEFKKTESAYADMLSGRADKETIEKYKDIFDQKKQGMPAANISVNSLIGVLSQDKTGDVLSGFVGAGRKLNHQELEEAAKNIYIGNKTLAQLCPKRENMSDEEVTRRREQLLKDNFNNLLVNNDKEPQLMSIRDKNGVLKPLKIINLAKEPKAPTPVKLYSKFETHFHFDSTVAANIKAYEEYINKNEDYKRDKALYDKLTKYNNSAESTRLKIINEERFGPTQRPVNVNQLQMTNGTARQNTPALTQPAAQRGAAQNERAME